MSSFQITVGQIYENDLNTAALSDQSLKQNISFRTNPITIFLHQLFYQAINLFILSVNCIEFFDNNCCNWRNNSTDIGISKMPQHIHIFRNDRLLLVVRVATKKCANNTFERLNVVSCRERSCRENRRHWNSVWESEQRISRQIIAASKLQRCKNTEKENKNRQIWNKAFIKNMMTKLSGKPRSGGKMPFSQSCSWTNDRTAKLTIMTKRQVTCLGHISINIHEYCQCLRCISWTHWSLDHWIKK